MITLNAITLVTSLSANQEASPRKNLWAIQRSPLHPFLFIFKETYKWFWGSGNKKQYVFELYSTFELPIVLFSLEIPIGQQQPALFEGPRSK